MNAVNITWQQDELGLFWTADLLNDTGEKIGVVGNYYDVDERGLGKEAQLKKAGLDMIEPLGGGGDECSKYHMATR